MPESAEFTGYSEIQILEFRREKITTDKKCCEIATAFLDAL